MKCLSLIASKGGGTLRQEEIPAPFGSGHSKQRWRRTEFLLLAAPLLVLLCVFGWSGFRNHLESKRVRRTFPAFYRTSALAFLSNGSVLAGADGSATAQLWLWDFKTGEVLHTVKTGHNAAVWSLAFSPDDRMIVTSGRDDGRLLLWDVQTGKKSGQLTGSLMTTNSLFFSPDGGILVVAGYGTVEVWDVQTRRLLRTWKEKSGNVFAGLLPNGKTLWTASNDGIKLRDLRSGRWLRTLIENMDKECLQATLSPNGKTLALGTRSGQGQAETIQLRDVQTGKLLSTWQDNAGNKDAPWNALLQAIAFSPDSKALASSSANQGIRLRDGRTGRLLQTLTSSPYTTSLAFSPDGRTLAAGVKREVYLWNLEALEQD